MILYFVYSKVYKLIELKKEEVIIIIKRHTQALLYIKAEFSVFRKVHIFPSNKIKIVILQNLIVQYYIISKTSPIHVLLFRWQHIQMLYFHNRKYLSNVNVSLRDVKVQCCWIHCLVFHFQICALQQPTSQNPIFLLCNRMNML